MGLRKYVAFMVVLVLVAFAVSSCSGANTDEVWGHDKSDEAKVKSEEAVGDAKEATESWTGWAMEKISENLGLKTDDALDAAKKTKDKATLSASESDAGGEYGYDKGGDVKNTGGEKDKAYDVAEEAKRRGGEKAEHSTGKARDSAYKTGEEAKNIGVEKGEEASHLTGQAKEKGKEAYNMADKAKDKAAEKGNEAYDMTRKAKDKAFESAEKATANDVYNKAGEKAGQVKEATQGNLEWAKEKAKQGYEAAKSKAKDTLAPNRDPTTTNNYVNKRREEEL